MLSHCRIFEVEKTLETFRPCLPFFQVRKLKLRVMECLFKVTVGYMFPKGCFLTVQSQSSTPLRKGWELTVSE